MPKQMNPTEIALAYSELDTDQRAEFERAVELINHVTEKLGHGFEKAAPKRGRPAGSKNRKPAEAEQVELVEKLYGNNAAVAEGL